MSVYTLLNQKQLEDLLSQYGITQLKAYSEIADGIENSNYLITTDSKEYVLTVFERGGNADFIPYLSFMAEAQAQGKPVPCPLLNNQGERLSFFDYTNTHAKSSVTVKRFILCERLPGSHPRTTSIALCEHLGEQIAEFHSLTFSNTLRKQFPFQDLASFILPLDFDNLLTADKLKLYKEEKENITTLNALAIQHDLSIGLGHCDFFPDNALTLFENNKERISAFLDWYDTKNCFLLIDLAIVAVSWCTTENSLCKDKERALLKGYQKIRPFNVNEETLWNSFLKAAALFFWISREDYHAQMHLQGKGNAINPLKSTDEFYRLLLSLKLR